MSFRACQVPGPAGTASIYTYTDVSCDCSAGDITIQVFLPMPNGYTVDYRYLNETPHAGLLNASRCDSESTGSQTRSYCIKFTNLTMAGHVNGSELVAEVTNAFEVTSSRTCTIIIVVQGKDP